MQSDEWNENEVDFICNCVDVMYKYLKSMRFFLIFFPH